MNQARTLQIVAWINSHHVEARALSAIDIEVKLLFTNLNTGEKGIEIIVIPATMTEARAVLGY